MISFELNKHTTSVTTKPKLLIIELWGLGDLVMATPFIRAASERFEVTVLAKNYANDLKPRFWPDVKVITWNAPWTAFRRKYLFWQWPWRTFFSICSRLRKESFDFAASGRWDPRDHGLMFLIGAKNRLGFPRMASQLFLTQSFYGQPGQHRYDYWRQLAHRLNISLPARNALPHKPAGGKRIVIHTGASQPTRIWPAEKFKALAEELRLRNYRVQIACDVSQRQWWLKHEPEVFTAMNVSELIQLFDSASLFIGNDSGPGHLAAMCGIPTISIFGPSFPEEYAPLHPLAAWIDGKPCAFKPCKDDCRFPKPLCIYETSEGDIWPKLQKVLDLANPERSPPTSPKSICGNASIRDNTTL